MKKKFKTEMNMLLILLFIILININLAKAEFAIGNKSYEIELNYNQGENLRGWINLSFQNEEENSLFTILNYEIKLKDFLEKNNIDYTCFPIDCGKNYLKIGNSANEKSFSLEERKTKIIGIEITGEIEDVDDLSFNISTNAGKSCINPIKIDLLDDGFLEFKHKVVSNDFCFIEKPFGCFESNYKNQTDLIENTLYCEKIKIPPVRGFYIGAIVNGSGNANFVVSIADKECEISTNSGGEIKCKVELDNEFPTFSETEVCIKPLNLNGNNYKINYEDHEPCGYTVEDTPTNSHDFEIFAKPLKYDSITKLNFNQELLGENVILKDYINNYITNKYNNNCSNGCLIPIRIYSGINQNLVINNLNFKYKVHGLQQTKNSFYELSESKLKISTNFVLLNLERANFKLPSLPTSRNITNITLELKFKDQRIFREIAKVIRGMNIIAILPTKVPALVPNRFVVLIEGNVSNFDYFWDFGDGSSEKITKTNYVKHTYTNPGSYILKVNVTRGSIGVVKTMNITVEPPRESIEKTIRDYRKLLTNVSSEIDKLPLWLINEIKGDNKIIDITGLNSQLNKLNQDYQDAFTNDEYTKVMTDLLNLKIPKKFSLINSLRQSRLVQTENQIDVNSLSILEQMRTNESLEKYPSAINNWIKNNLETNFEFKNYAIEYYNELYPKFYFSVIKITITPKNKIDKLFLIIKKEQNNIKFNGNFDTETIEDRYTAIKFEDFSDPKTIEFLYPEKIEINNLPFFISPSLSDLSIVSITGVCNNNKICEKDRGEDYKNCRNDCKPWKLTILFLSMLFFIAFVVYIILQEWYKKYYESSLFQNKNQLYNLINFMYISTNQGLSKKEIFKKLESYNWKKEQLEYAWRKLKGQRTGMWEIPIFKMLENRKVKKEIEKRKKQSKFNI